MQRINADIIQDKAGLPWWLGLGVKGIAVYDHNDRKTPRKVCELVQCDTRTVQVLLPGGLGGTTGSASDSRSEGRGFDSH